MTNFQCTIKKKNDKVIAEGVVKENPYKVIPYDNKIHQVAQTLATCKNNNCNRLGHRNLADVKQLEREKLAEGFKLHKCKNELCAVCVQSKLTEMRFAKESQLWS